MSLRCFGKLSDHRLSDHSLCDQTVSVAEPVEATCRTRENYLIL